MRIKPLWLLLAAFLIFGLTTPVKAQANPAPTLDSLEIDLWGEYDQPSMLVIYHIVLASGTPMPATLTLRIPLETGTPYNVASREQDGQLYNLTYSRKVEGDWSLITFTTTSNEVQFEYYDPALTKNGTQRSYAYEWQGDYAVKSLSLQVQQPVGAKDMQITPPLGSATTGEGGMTYYTTTVGAIAAGQKFKLSLAYAKETDELSAPALPVEPNGPVSEQTPGRSPNMNTVLWVSLLALGVLLVAGGGIWYWQSSKVSAAPKKHRSHGGRSSSAQADGPAASSDERIYCHQCGKRAAEGDLFCRACGARLQVG